MFREQAILRSCDIGVNGVGCKFGGVNGVKYGDDSVFAEDDDTACEVDAGCEADPGCDVESGSTSTSDESVCDEYVSPNFKPTSVHISFISLMLLFKLVARICRLFLLI